MPAPDAVTIDKPARLVGTPRCPVLLDVRPEAARAASPRLVPGARPPGDAEIAPEAAARLGATLAGPAVVLCAEGHRRSQAMAALPRSAGTAAEYLEGGHSAWAAAGLPLVDPAKITGQDGGSRSLWVTPARPKIDRIACPWLIRRFVDPRAVFPCVARAEVAGVADLLGAMPCDIEDVFWSHRGAFCTFDTMIAGFGLSTPALSRLAAVVRAADTARPDLAPEAAGLLAASLGLSRMHSDDLRQLEAGMALHDAFSRRARDATDETHDWPTNRPGGTR